MQNELRVLLGGLYPRPQANPEADFESGHGLQRRPSVAIEDVRDSRGGDARRLRDPWNPPMFGNPKSPGIGRKRLTPGLIFLGKQPVSAENESRNLISRFRLSYRWSFLNTFTKISETPRAFSAPTRARTWDKRIMSPLL